MKRFFTKAINKFLRIFYYIKLKKKNVFIKVNSHIARNTKFDGNNFVDNKSLILDSNIGRGTYIQSNWIFIKCKIGK